MDQTYKTGGDPNDRLPVPAGRPAAPAGYPITTAGRQPSHPAFDDPFATEYEGSGSGRRRQGAGRRPSPGAG